MRQDVLWLIVLLFVPVARTIGSIVNDTCLSYSPYLYIQNYFNACFHCYLFVAYVLLHTLFAYIFVFSVLHVIKPMGFGSERSQ